MLTSRSTYDNEQKQKAWENAQQDYKNWFQSIFISFNEDVKSFETTMRARPFDATHDVEEKIFNDFAKKLSALKKQYASAITHFKNNYSIEIEPLFNEEIDHFFRLFYSLRENVKPDNNTRFNRICWHILSLKETFQDLQLSILEKTDAINPFPQKKLHAISFQTSQDILYWHNRIKGISEEALRNKLLVARDGRTYFLDDIFSSEPNEADDLVSFVYWQKSASDNKPSIISLSNLRKQQNLADFKFIYNAALAETLHQVTPDEENSGAIDSIRLPKCNLTGKPMVSVLITPYGYSYNTDALQQHMATSQTDPKTNEPLFPGAVPNKALESLNLAYLQYVIANKRKSVAHYDKLIRTLRITKGNEASDSVIAKYEAIRNRHYAQIKEAKTLLEDELNNNQAHLTSINDRMARFNDDRDALFSKQSELANRRSDLQGELEGINPQEDNLARRSQLRSVIPAAGGSLATFGLIGVLVINIIAPPIGFVILAAVVAAAISLAVGYGIAKLVEKYSFRHSKQELASKRSLLKQKIATIDGQYADVGTKLSQRINDAQKSDEKVILAKQKTKVESRAKHLQECLDVIANEEKQAAIYFKDFSAKQPTAAPAVATSAAATPSVATSPFALHASSPQTMPFAMDDDLTNDNDTTPLLGKSQ